MRTSLFISFVALLFSFYACDRPAPKVDVDTDPDHELVTSTSHLVQQDPGLDSGYVEIFRAGSTKELPFDKRVVTLEEYEALPVCRFMEVTEGFIEDMVIDFYYIDHMNYMLGTDTVVITKPPGPTDTVPQYQMTNVKAFHEHFASRGWSIWHNIEDKVMRDSVEVCDFPERFGELKNCRKIAIQEYFQLSQTADTLTPKQFKFQQKYKGWLSPEFMDAHFDGLQRIMVMRHGAGPLYRTYDYTHMYLQWDLADSLGQ